MADDPSRAGPRWREDFPIRWERDHYVTRRELAKFLTLGSGILVAANAATLLAGRVPHAEETPRLRIANASQVPEHGSVLFRYPTDADPCILVRTPEGALAAFSQVCTHLSCAVVYEEGALKCPCHEGVFECSEGRPVAGPPIRSLPRVRLQLIGDEVFATGVDV